MSDIAQLGLQIDSSQVTAASAALDRLAAAARPAVSAATNLQTAASAANTTLGAHAKASNTAATAHAGMSVQGMAAFHSLRSLTEQMAMGVPITTALGQQLNHLSFAAGGPGGLSGAFGEAIGALTRFINPTTLVIGGLAAVAGGAFYAYTRIKETELAFGALADRANTTVLALHSFQSAAAFKGIDQADFLKNMEKFADLTTQAQHGMGSLAELFRANGIAAGSLDENLLRAADLIKNAGNDAERYQIVQQMGLPATRQWVEYLKQGSAGIKAASDAAVKFGDDADVKLIDAARRFDEKWNTAWTNFTNGGKSAFVTVYDKITSIDKFLTDHPMLAKVLSGAVVNIPIVGGILGAGGAAVSVLTTPVVPPSSNAGKIGPFDGSGGNGPTVNPDQIKHTLEIEQQRISILGQTASIIEIVKQKENEITLARLNGVNVTKEQAANLRRLAEEQALGITQTHSQTDALTVQAQSFGMLAGDAAAYSSVQTRINEAIRNGNPLTAENIAKLKQESAALRDATQNLDNMRMASDLLSSGWRDFRTQLQQGAGAWNALRAAASNALNSIADKLVDMAEKNLVANAFGGGGGIFSSIFGGGGFLSGIFGGGGDIAAGAGKGVLSAIAHTGYGPGDSLPTRVVDAGVFATAPRFHTGIGPGERAAVIRDDEGVFTPNQMRALAPASRAGGGQPIVITSSPTFVNADPQSEARLRSYVDQSNRQLATQIMQAIPQTKRNAPGRGL